MVELMARHGREPTTFPLLPGRAHQGLDETPLLLPLDILLATHRLTAGFILLRIHQFPWTAISKRQRVIGVVVCDSLFQVLSLSDVEPTGALTLKNMEMKGHGFEL